MRKNRETCQQYVARRLSEDWRIISQAGFNVVLQSPEGIIRPVDLRNDIETLRPNAAGDETSIAVQSPTSGEHWDKVGETVTNDATIVWIFDELSYQRDLYNLPPHSVGSGTINSVTIYFRITSGDNLLAVYAKPSQKSGLIVTDGTEQSAIGNFWITKSQTYTTNPATGNAYTWAEIDAFQIGVCLKRTATAIAGCSQVYVEVDYTPSVTAPTVTTQAVTDIAPTTATGNGTITATGGENCTRRGFCYKVGTSGDPTTADSVAYDDGSFPAGAYTKAITGLSTGTSYRVRAYAVNSGGTGYGTTVQILTKPAAPTSVAASDGAYTDKVVVTWTKSTGATGYQVYRDGAALGWLGDVATYDDTGAAAPSITPGAAVASDGLYVDKVALSLSGQSANNGTTHTYKVRARNATGESADSTTNTGYRGVGTLTYQWQRSAGDSNGSYSDISGATTASYNDTGAPADGSGRYYRCVENATGAAQQTSTSNRGYRATYYASGYIGDVIDCTALVDKYDRLEWTEELDSQNIEIKIRSSPDQATWSTWETIYSSPCTSFTTPVQRYLEWRATLSSDTTATPKLKDLTFNWTKKVE